MRDRFTLATDQGTVQARFPHPGGWRTDSARYKIALGIIDRAHIIETGTESYRFRACAPWTAGNERVDARDETRTLMQGGHSRSSKRANREYQTQPFPAQGREPDDALMVSGWCWDVAAVAPQFRLS